jgi:predicted MFS family arabinose efflux permease
VLLGRIVGTERTGIMVAWITVIHQAGGALAAYLAGVLRISFGSCWETFLLAGLLCFAAALVALLIGLGRRRTEPGLGAVPAG